MRNRSAYSRFVLLSHGLMAVILTLGLVVIAPNASAQGGAVIRIDPANSTVSLGGSVVVNVRIENVTNLAGAEVHLTYDPFIVEAQIEPGGFPAPDFIVQSSATGGRIDFAAAQMPDQHPPVSGSGVLLKITFRGVADGTSSIGITSAILSDGSGSIIASTSQGGSVSVGASPSPTTPAPTTPAPTPPPTSTPVPGTTRVIVSPPALSLNVGATGTQAVRVENVTGLWGVAYRLTYDASIVQCIDMQTGPTPAADILARKACGNGVAEYAVTQQAPREPAAGSGDSVRLTFKCLKPGTSPITLDQVKLVNRDGLDLSRTVANGQITCAAGSPSGSRHTVRPGETLFCIGRAYGILPWAIATANNLGWPYRLYAGQVLIIPNVPWTNIPPGPICQRQFEGTPPPVTPPAPDCRVQYSVRPGDTLFSIARRYGTDPFTLAVRNHIHNPNLIFVGQSLCIP